tara:strand:- start:2750 stop:3568 length:819 start_codon:yes stop_codon:yes gene_type:complete
MKDNIRWVIQSNLINDGDLQELRDGCTDIGVEYESVIVLPYSKQMPEFTIDDKINIYYGSTTFMYNLYEQLNAPIGLFYNHETYSMVNYMDKWGEYMLNCDAHIIKVGDFFKEDRDPEENVFIRPDGDGKEIDGQVKKFKDAVPWLERYLKYDNRLTLESNILVGPAYNLFKEWRLYIVNNEIVTASRYRKDFKLSKSSEDIPEEMLEFARERISEYSPHDSYAMDIASVHDGEYYIIECGCLNSVGFYHADIKKIVRKVSEYICTSKETIN